MNVDKQVYSGHDAVKDFLDPANHPYLPLIEIPKSLNPYYSSGIRIYAKLMMFLPLGNVKSIPARELILGAPAGARNIVEASSGNTVFSMGIIGRAHGHPKTRALVSKEVSEGKLKLLQLAGVDIEIVDEPICPDPGDPNGAIFQAKTKGGEEGWFNPGQYDNDANPNAHEQFTAPQIYDQLDGKVDIFAAGLGTTGTLLGTSRYLIDKNPRLKVIGVARKPNNSVPGVRTLNLLREVTFNWEELLSAQTVVGTRESYEMSLKLIRLGILAGPSSGFVLQGLIEGIKGLIDEKKITLGKPMNAVCIFPDGPMPYIDDYFINLPSKLFPAIANADLLEHNVRAVAEGVSNTTIETISATALREIDSRLVKLIDVREPSEFEDHHIDTSINIPLKSLTDVLPRVVPTKETTIVMICRSGVRSLEAASVASSLGYQAKSLEGGTTAWSAMGYERVRPGYCKT